MTDPLTRNWRKWLRRQRSGPFNLAVPIIDRLVVRVETLEAVRECARVVYEFCCTHGERCKNESALHDALKLAEEPTP